MTNVVKLPSSLNPDHVLEAAVGQYDKVVLVGWDKDGNLDFRVGGNMTMAQSMFVLQAVVHKTFNGDYFDGSGA